jgi:hypothetical protein
MPPTELDLDRLEELAGAATPGPWKTNVTVFSERDVVITDWLKEGSHLVLADLSFECTYVGLTLEERRANARLIVALRNALPAILAKLREGEREDPRDAEIERLREALVEASRLATMVANIIGQVDNWCPTTALCCVLNLNGIIKAAAQALEETAKRLRKEMARR